MIFLNIYSIPLSSVGLAMRLKKGEKGDTIGVPCPACAVVTTVSKNEGASGLKKNVTLKNVLGKIKVIKN
jgi:hypothetical protein